MWKVFALVVWVELVRSQIDFVPTQYEEVTQETMGDIGAIDRCGEGSQRGRFHCISYHRCDPTTNTTIPEETVDDENYDYSVLIDIRLGSVNPCKETLHVCCKIGNDPVDPVEPTSQKPKPTTDGQQPSTETPQPPSPKPTISQCGIRNNNGIDFKITGNTHNEAEYGEFPWMVAILKANFDPAVDQVQSICGGSLIAPRVILTGAHCVHKHQIGDLKVRAGEWDTQTTNERYPYQERNVAQIILHEKFKDGVLFNDVALLVLEAPFTKAKHIGTICLPDQNEVVLSKECFGTGWGKNLFGREGEYQVILKKIELPIVPREDCEDELKRTRLGNHFRLHESFTCAGGIEGKDTCTGDGGSPLVCPDPKNPLRYVQAGIVAWGIGCGTRIPGVYSDVAKFRNWVDDHMRRLNLGDTTYTS